MIEVIKALEVSIGVYFAVVLLWSYLLIISATRQIWRDRKQQINEPQVWPKISILIPMYNEEVVILDTLDHIFDMEYPGELEVCVTDDGSTDKSFKLILKNFLLENMEDDTGANINVFKSHTNPLIVIQRPNGGRAAALNTCLTQATGKYVISTDADTVIDPEGLRKIICMMENDPDLQSVGGSILISNNKFIRLEHKANVVSSNPLIGTQIVEYIRSFVYGRMGLNKLGGNLIVSGAFGVFRRNKVIELGGWSEESLAEDLDMTVKVREDGGQVLFIPDPVAWTEAPSDLKTLGNQRDRWYRGLTQGLWKWKNRMFTKEPTEGLSRITMPYYWIVEWLSPIVQVLGLILIITHLIWYSFNWPYVLYLLGVAYILVVGLSIWSLALEQTYYKRYQTSGDTLKLITFALIEPFWYGPIHVYWRLRGLFKYLLYRDKQWGIMKRTGSKIALFLLMMLPSPAVAQLNWAESYLYTEQTQVNRTEINTTISWDITTFTYRQAWHNELYDDQIRVGIWYDYDKRFGIHGSSAASISNVSLVPTHEQDWNVYGVVGPVVLQTGATWRWWNNDAEDHLVQFTQRIEYYIGDNMLDFNFSNVPEMNISWAKMGVRHFGETYDYTIFGIVGEQLLDFPLFIGPTRVAGTMFYIPKGHWEFRPGIVIGDRNNTIYTGITLGTRYTF